jgi:manganese/zinc/iron transport system substrate-binding protein
MWMQTVETVRDVLIEIDPQGADIYRENAKSYLAELEALHGYIQEQASRIPEEMRVLITAHDAFNYFGRAYGFEVRGLQGISTASEVGAADVQGLAEFIAERKIPAIFIESSVPPRNIEAVQAAVRSRGFEVTIGGELFSDALGSSGTAEENYIGTVRYNVDTIVTGLGN